MREKNKCFLHQMLPSSRMLDLFSRSDKMTSWRCLWVLITSYKGNFEGGKVIHFEGSLAGRLLSPSPELSSSNRCLAIISKHARPNFELDMTGSHLGP